MVSGGQQGIKGALEASRGCRGVRDLQGVRIIMGCRFQVVAVVYVVSGDQHGV